jgi:hypothetical protein
MSKHNRERRMGGNYVAPAIAKAQQALDDGTMRRGQLYRIDIYHDEWCALVNGNGTCNCTPIIRPPSRIPLPEEN